MTRFHKRTLTALAAATVVAMTGCGGNISSPSVVTAKHIQIASALCEPNGGVDSIAKARREVEEIYCGKGCWQTTGIVFYDMVTSCKNGAVFSGRNPINIKEQKQ